MCGLEATDGIEGCFEFEQALGNVKVSVLFSDGGSGELVRLFVCLLGG